MLVTGFEVWSCKNSKIKIVHVDSGKNNWCNWTKMLVWELNLFCLLWPLIISMPCFIQKKILRLCLAHCMWHSSDCYRLVRFVSFLGVELQILYVKEKIFELDNAYNLKHVKIGILCLCVINWWTAGYIEQHKHWKCSRCFTTLSACTLGYQQRSIHAQAVIFLIWKQ